MNLIDVLFLAVALSIDATAVAFAYGMCFNEKRLKNSFSLAGFCGVFQGIMPIIGYFILTSYTDLLEPFSKWIVFTIFLLLGLNIIKEAIKSECEEIKCLDLKCLFAIAIATSIDALAAGIGLALERVSIFKASALIALVTFINTMLGFWEGNTLKKFPTKILKIFAGLLLILLAIKALI